MHDAHHCKSLKLEGGTFEAGFPNPKQCNVFFYQPIIYRYVNDIVEALFFLPFEEYNIFCMARCFQIQTKKNLGVFCGPGRPTSCLPPSTPPEKILRGTKEIQKKTKHCTHLYLLYPWYFLLTPTHSGLNIIQLYP